MSIYEGFGGVWEDSCYGCFSNILFGEGFNFED